MTKKGVLGFFLILAVVSGCASRLGYYPAHNTGEGYTDKKIQDDIFSVQYRGRSDSDIMAVSDFALLRSSEITLANGFNYFSVMTGTPDNKNFPVPAGSDVPIECIGRHCFHSSFPFWESYTQTIPGIYFMIQCYKEKPANPKTAVFDARQVKKNLEEQYGVGSGNEPVKAA